MKLAGILAIIVLAFAAPAAKAESLPSFSIDDCTWHATHVVVVTEGEEIDGKVTVLESWKGDLVPGQSLLLPELAKFASRDSRLIGKAWWEKDEVRPAAYVTGRRMILFLKQMARSEDGVRTWTGANPDGMAVSVAWVDDDIPYEIVQTMNPGDAALIRNFESEQSFKDAFLEINKIRTTFDRALAMKEPAARARALAPLTASKLSIVQWEVFDALHQCGHDALPMLRALSCESASPGVSAQAIGTMGEIGGTDVAAELTAILQDELPFWKTTARELEGAPPPPPDAETLLPAGFVEHYDPWTTERRSHHTKTFAALAALEKLKYRGCRDVVRELREVWHSMPQLQRPGILDVLGAACDAILAQQ